MTEEEASERRSSFAKLFLAFRRSPEFKVVAEAEKQVKDLETEAAVAGKFARSSEGHAKRGGAFCVSGTAKETWDEVERQIADAATLCAKVRAAETAAQRLHEEAFKLFQDRISNESKDFRSR